LPSRLVIAEISSILLHFSHQWKKNEKELINRKGGLGRLVRFFPPRYKFPATK